MANCHTYFLIAVIISQQTVIPYHHCHELWVYWSFYPSKLLSFSSFCVVSVRRVVIYKASYPNSTESYQVKMTLDCDSLELTRKDVTRVIRLTYLFWSLLIGCDCFEFIRDPSIHWISPSCLYGVVSFVFELCLILW